jgi:hypothetical protein
MSFAFNAVGTRDEVAGQLEHAQISIGGERFNELGAELRDLLVKHFEQETASAGAGHEYRYTVKATGHGGGSSPLSVNLAIEPHWIHLTPAGEAALDAETDPDYED